MSGAGSRVSLAIENLRGYVVLMVVAFHSFVAYMASQPASQPPFDAPPYDWMAHPIIDSHRWLGFDLFGAFQFLQLMQLMFFLSGLFVWSSLVRKGPATFIRDRIVRLGVPFVLGAFLLMPLAYYPVYRVGAVDPSWSGYWSHWMALPFWPSGPMWFLWSVLALNLIAAGVYWLAPRSGKYLGRLSVYVGTHPFRFFVGLVIASALAYLPMAANFSPWQWVEFGPFAFQPGFSLEYAIYFFAGLTVGVYGFQRGFLAANETLGQYWLLWVAGAFAAFLLWVIPAALIVKGQSVQLPLLPIARELGLLLFSATACLGSIAVFLRFTSVRRPFLGSLSDNTYGIYLFHYLFVVWTQFALLDLSMPAIVKGAIVLSVTLVLSWGASAAVSSVPLGARLIGGARRAHYVESRSAAKSRSQFGLSD
jgi:glucans biosynthesis protein C